MSSISFPNAQPDLFIYLDTHPSYNTNGQYTAPVILFAFLIGLQCCKFYVRSIRYRTGNDLLVSFDALLCYRSWCVNHVSCRRGYLYLQPFSSSNDWLIQIRWSWRRSTSVSNACTRIVWGKRYTISGGWALKLMSRSTLDDCSYLPSNHTGHSNSLALSVLIIDHISAPYTYRILLHFDLANIKYLYGRPFILFFDFLSKEVTVLKICRVQDSSLRQHGVPITN